MHLLVPLAEDEDLEGQHRQRRGQRQQREEHDERRDVGEERRTGSTRRQRDTGEGDGVLLDERPPGLEPLAAGGQPLPVALGQDLHEAQGPAGALLDQLADPLRGLLPGDEGGVVGDLDLLAHDGQADAEVAVLREAGAVPAADLAAGPA